MVEIILPPAASGADEPEPRKTDAPRPSNAKQFVKDLFDEHPVSDEFREVLRAGYIGLETGDLVLARAAAENVIARAASGSGSLMRAMILRAMVHEQMGSTARCNTLIQCVLRGEF